MRNLTPPYISSTPEITYRRLDSLRQSLSATPTRFLILASDGFADLCGDDAGGEAIVRRWAQGLTALTGGGPADDSWTSGKHVSVRGSNNMALRLLREALGGDDHLSVSKVLTLNMETAWIDDTAIIVQTL